MQTARWVFVRQDGQTQTPFRGHLVRFADGRAPVSPSFWTLRARAEEERIEEIARLLSASEVTDAARMAARELIKQ